jgi:hypothetical protein
MCLEFTLLESEKFEYVSLFEKILELKPEVFLEFGAREANFTYKLS